MKLKPNCVIVDDEEASLSLLKNHIEKLGLLSIERSFLDPDQFLAESDTLTSNIVFLDMDMPIQGDEIAKKLTNKNIIFVSAHQEQAHRAFDVDAIDFVRKPIKLHRLKTAIEKVLKSLSGQMVLKTSTAAKEIVNSEELVVIKTDEREKRDKKILLVNGTKIVAKNISHEKLVNGLGPEIIQVNQSESINVKYVKKMINRDLIGLEGTSIKPIEITLGDKYRSAFFLAKPEFKTDT